MDLEHTIRFTLGDMVFEYSEDKNQANIRKHGISFRNAARVFFDYDRIEMYDEENSDNEERYDTIGDTSAGNLIFGKDTIIGNVSQSTEWLNDILFVVYTERRRTQQNGQTIDVTRLISARMATNFERIIMVNTNDLSTQMREELAFTKEELRELENARKMPITFDEDCPETTPERAIKFRRVNPARRGFSSSPA